MNKWGRKEIKRRKTVRKEREREKEWETGDEGKKKWFGRNKRKVPKRRKGGQE